MNAPNRNLKQRVYHGMKDFLVITCYLWVVFALMVLYRSVISSEQHIPFALHGIALINALALAKVMLVAQELHFGEWFNEAPLIYTTLFKSAAFALVLGCFKILEELLIGLYHGHSFNESISAVGGTLSGILVLMAILAVLLIPFFAFTELGKILGKDKLKQLLFTSRHVASGSS
jgi:pilus assembly protein TadC